MCAGTHAGPNPVQNPLVPDWYTTALSFAGGPVPCQAGFPAFAFRFCSDYQEPSGVWRTACAAMAQAAIHVFF